MAPGSSDAVPAPATVRAFLALQLAFLIGQALSVQSNQYRMTGTLDMMIFTAVFANAPGTLLGAFLVFRRERRLRVVDTPLWQRCWHRAVSLALFTAVVYVAAIAAEWVTPPYTGRLLVPGIWKRPAFYGTILSNAPSSFAVAWIVARGTVMYETAWRAQRAEADQRVARERETALRSAIELRMLRTYMQPHFLFNTLNVIASLTDDRPREARRALVTTADLLRSALIDSPDADDLTRLRDELEVVHHYLAIEQLRMVGRLHVVESIDPETLRIDLPRFTIQTLVENAVRHGLFPAPEGGTLTITTARTTERLTITVADTGVGCERSALSGSDGFGLKALTARLEGVYGGAARLTFETAPGRGFLATVELPLESDGA